MKILLLDNFKSIKYPFGQIFDSNPLILPSVLPLNNSIDFVLVPQH